MINKNDICICVLAYNEQRHIADTVRTLAQISSSLSCEIKVYANGCTDRTAQIVRALIPEIPNLSLRELKYPNKANAWNTAFYENPHAILVFSDGDVIPEKDSIKALWQVLADQKSNVALAGCTFWPKKNLPFAQLVAGFLQIPVRQNFLSGQLYAIRRTAISQEFSKRNLMGIPLGVVAEDTFLERLVSTARFVVLKEKVYYEPPTFQDYLKYLARIRWQEEQLTITYKEFLAQDSVKNETIKERIWAKAPADCSEVPRFLLGMVASGSRIILKYIFNRKVNLAYMKLGPVERDGREVLSRTTRSISVK